MGQVSTGIRRCEGEGCNLRGDIVNVLIGQGEQKFAVHESVLRAHSPFFEAALKNEWKESKEREVKLPEDNPETFHAYFQWLYSGVIYCEVLSVFIANSKDKSDRPPSSGGRRFPGVFTVKHIYNNTPGDSPARRLMVDVYVKHGCERWFSPENHEPETISHDFLIDLAIAQYKKRSLKWDTIRELDEMESGTGCAYHHHGEDEPCSVRAA